MKSSTITLAMTLALSSSSSISGMPHSYGSRPHTLLSKRFTTHMVRGPLLHGQSVDYAQASPYKGGSESERKKSNVKSSQKDDTDDDEDCEDSLDSKETNLYPGDGVDQTKFKTDSNTADDTPSSKSDLPSRRPRAPETSKRARIKSESLSQWPHSPVAPKISQSYAGPSWSPHSQGYKSGFNNKYHGGMEGGYHGKATFFSQGGTPGACGKIHQDSDYIVAIQSSMYGGGKFCGKTVMVTRKSTGQTIKCIAADACPGCPTQQSLDLSIGAFKALGTPDEGVFDIKWEVLD